MRRSTMGRAGLAALLTITLGAVLPARAASPRTQSSSAASAAYVAQLDWGRCTDRVLRRFKAECAMLTVPLDHAAPGGPTIQVAVSRILHTKEPYRGAVFTNAGGPGGSGLFLALGSQVVPRGVGKTYDWYGFDTRGVGESRPALGCDNRYYGWDRAPYEPSTPAIMRYWRRKTKGYAEACARSASAALLDHMKTTDLVADYEAMRVAIGVDQVTYYGVSYGTYLGQVYATLHPERITAMVWDGVVDPSRVFYKTFLDQDRALERTLAAFFDWIADHVDVFDLGETRAEVRRAYARLHAQLAQRPADGKVGPDELDDALEPAVFHNDSWVAVARAFARLADRGDATGIKRLYREGYPVGRGADNYNAASHATLCTDAPWPADWRTWLDDARRVAEQAPYYTWASTWSGMPCRTWPSAASTPVQIDSSGFTAPVLMVNETLDGATPYAGSLAARAIWPTAALVAGVGGTSHFVGLSGVACTDNAIADLLEDGSLPRRRAGDRADKECPGLPPPG